MANPMLDQGPVPKVVHGAIEYLAGVALIVMPLLLDIEAEAAIALSVIIGILVLVVAAATERPPGMIELIPLEIHAVLDFVLAVFLIATPFVFGFTEEFLPTVVFVGLGVVHLLLTMGTRFRTGEPRRKKSPSV